MAMEEKKKSFSTFIGLEREPLKEWLLSLFQDRPEIQENIEKAFKDWNNYINGRHFQDCKTPELLRTTLRKDCDFLGLTSPQASHVSEFIVFDVGIIAPMPHPDLSVSIGGVVYSLHAEKETKPPMALLEAVDKTPTLIPQFCWESVKEPKLLRCLSQREGCQVWSVCHNQELRVLKLYSFSEYDHAENEAALLQYLANGSWTPKLQGLVSTLGGYGLLLEPISTTESCPFQTTSDLRGYIRQLFEALESIHRCGVIHGDIKPSNVLWDCQRNQIMIIDFGYSVLLEPGKEEVENIGGTPQFMPPEIMYPDDEAKITRAVDVWSAGALIAILLNIPMDECADFQWVLDAEGVADVRSWARCRGAVLSPLFTQELLDFLKFVMEWFFEHRPTAAQVLQHPFLQLDK